MRPEHPRSQQCTYERYETLLGILTLNYDDFIEKAAQQVFDWKDADLDFHKPRNSEQPLLLKLHGSFFWKDEWPLLRCTDAKDPLWIPSGIQKRKDHYPFNILWGIARNVLDCDILRIIGCRLGPNDWGLISLIFSTYHANHNNREPYSIEIIDSPKHAFKLKKNLSIPEHNITC